MYKSFALALIAATVVQAAPGRGGRKRAEKRRYQDTAFNAFVSKYNKDVTSTAEFEKRQECYHKTDAKINQQNAKSLPGDKVALRYAHNMFSDMEPEEFQLYLGLNQKIEHNELSRGLPMHRPGRHLNNIPNAVNWASTENPQGQVRMFEVKNQGSCGSCWAFAVTSTLEGTLAIKTESAPVRLSEQQGVDCTLAHSQGGSYNEDDWGCWGCEGCWMSNHYNYLKKNGAMKNSDYEYQAKQLGRCDYQANKIVGKVASFTQIRDSVDDMKARVAQQPMDVAVCASGWGSVSTGIMRECCEGLNHAVTIVGYNLCGEDDGSDNDNNDGNDGDDTTPDPNPTPGPSDCNVDKWWYSCNDSAARRLQEQCVPYWIVQNSWSKHWGDNGFVKIEIKDGDGVCGINRVAEYADWAGLY